MHVHIYMYPQVYGMAHECNINLHSHKSFQGLYRVLRVEHCHCLQDEKNQIIMVMVKYLKLTRIWPPLY